MELRFIPRSIWLLALCAGVACGSDPGGAPAGPGSTGTSETSYMAPGIAFDGSNFDSAGTRLMRPFVLNAVIKNSFGVTLQIDSTGEGDLTNPLEHNESYRSAIRHDDREFYAVYLGGIDGDGATSPQRDATGVMPFVMDRIATNICSQLVASADSGISLTADLSDDEARNAAYQTLSRRFASRPATEEIVTSLESLRTAISDTTTFWRAACIFMLRKDGSLLLY